MRIAITTVSVPFIRGGAELLNEDLLRALKNAGHEVEQLSLPFRFGPPNVVLQNMEDWEAMNVNSFDCGPIDLVVSTKFPAFYAQHPNTVVWLMHQHRSVYELWNTPFGESDVNQESVDLRFEIHKRDKIHLEKARDVYTISQRVSDRLKEHNGVDSTALLLPPPNSADYYCGEQLPYILVPSRLETLKRQDLAIQALKHAPEGVKLVLVGSGGKLGDFKKLAESLNLSDRVLFLNHVSRQELVSWYANALGVYFAPFDEDYGYVTLEAMLSSKAVITCSDSGGPLSFVQDKVTGFVCDSTPESVGEAFTELWNKPSMAEQFGKNGLEAYNSLGLSWDKVVSVLTK